MFVGLGSDLQLRAQAVDEWGEFLQFQLQNFD